VDGIALLCVGLVILPVPVATTWRAMREVLLVAPDELDRQVQAVMDSIVAERGFISVRIATGFERGPSRMPAIQNRK
jgi:predicted Co/Zn/Cd cation transporter (cation efflux family)